MLQRMRDNTQSLGFKILVGAIIFVLTVFGFGAFNIFLNPDPAIASVNGEDITQRELQAETERARLRMLSQMGEGADPNDIDLVSLQSQVVEQMISREVLKQTLDDLSITSSKRRVDTTLVTNPTFQTDGAFNEDLYLRVLQTYGYSAQGFANATAVDLAIGQLQNGINASAQMPNWQLRWLIALVRQQRDLAYLPFEVARYEESVEVSDEEIEQHYDDNLLTYYTEASADAEYVQLSWEQLLSDPSIEITEEMVIEEYEAQKQEQAAGEQRRASHILLQVDADRDLAAALALADDVRARLDAGESFAELASELSDDPGSKHSGGSLGLAGRGVFVPEFEEALFALEVGQLSDPVETQFGVHLIRLEEVVVPEYPSLDEQRETLTETVREREARTLFAEQLREFDNVAHETDGLQQLAETFGLEVKTVTGVTREAGSGPFVHDVVRNALFDDGVLRSGYNSPAVEFDEQRAVVVRAAAYHEPAQQALADVHAEIEALLRREKAQAQIEIDVAQALEMLEADEGAGAVSDQFGGEWQTFTLATQGQPGIPADVNREAFALPLAEGVTGQLAVGRAGLDDEAGQAVVTVTRVKNGDIETLTEQEVDAMARFLQSRAANLDFNALFATAQADASISRSIGSADE